MPDKYTEWKLEDYIGESAERAAGVLQAAVDEDSGDGIVIRSVLGAIARSKGMSDLARQTGLNRGNLYRAMSRDGNMTVNTLLKITAALGLRLTVTPAAQPDQAAIAQESP